MKLTNHSEKFNNQYQVPYKQVDFPLEILGPQPFSQVEEAEVQPQRQHNKQ